MAPKPPLTQQAIQSQNATPWPHCRLVAAHLLAGGGGEVWDQALEQFYSDATK